jgi:hypothetical protein
MVYVSLYIYPHESAQKQDLHYAPLNRLFLEMKITKTIQMISPKNSCFSWELVLDMITEPLLSSDLAFIHVQTTLHSYIADS